MESVKLFLKELTHELLYNNVYQVGKIEVKDLHNEFRRKTGYWPMDFFGFGDGHGWFDFITRMPVLELGNIISVCDINDERKDIYKIINEEYITENQKRLRVSVYRESLLIKCCMIMKDYLAGVSRCKDANGNTPLHLIAALPGMFHNCPIMVKYLLQAGVDPLALNNDRQNFLHILCGRFQATNDGNGGLRFRNVRLICRGDWYDEGRATFLNILFKALPSAHITLLATAQDKNGNTVMHEWLFSTPIESEFHLDECGILEKLLTYISPLYLRLQNNYGEVPLHYAFNSKVFKSLLRNGAVVRARNDRDETPILFMLKMVADIAFTQSSLSTELAGQGFVKTTSDIRNYYHDNLLDNLMNIVSESEEVKHTAYIPDIEGNIAVDIVLIAIRLASYNSDIFHLFTDDLRSFFVKLLSELVHNASTSDLRRQNKKGQNFLHVLLDMGDDNKHTIVQEGEILQSVEILINHDVDVNAVDLKGYTPLDITDKHFNKGKSVYKKCAELLIKNRAKRNISSLGNQSRKLRSCPERHKNSALRLTDPSSNVKVVEKYRYFNPFPIGHGAFSTVFVAIKDENVDSRSGTVECRAYALKRLDKAKINPQEIKREITTLLSISGKCDNIVNYYESFEDGFFQYLCLDLMDGDLNEFVTNNVTKVLKTNVATRVTEEIVSGLAFLHENGFIHRDLKPGNILYTTDPALHFKIADFGLTKNISTSSTMTSSRGSGIAMAPGTRCWIAPELVSKKSREHTQETDVFSLGLVLHYLLTLGKHPFATEREEPTHVIERRIVYTPANLDRALHPEATNLLQNLLRKDPPTKRPPAKFLNQHPFLWGERKKIEFLKAVGDQPEAVSPGSYVNSELEKDLQKTITGQQVSSVPWDRAIEKLYEEVTKAWRQKKYRTDKVIDLLRFIRNSYAHKQERSLLVQEALDKNIFLRAYPPLVFDVWIVVRKLGFDESRSNIRNALSL